MPQRELRTARPVELWAPSCRADLLREWGFLNGLESPDPYRALAAAPSGAVGGGEGSPPANQGRGQRQIRVSSHSHQTARSDCGGADTRERRRDARHLQPPLAGLRRPHPRGDRHGPRISCGLPADCRCLRTAFPQVSGGDADELAHRPGSVPRPASRPVGWRPSIWDDRCRPPRAIHPHTRAGRPQSCAHRTREGAASRSCSRWGLPSRSGHPERWWSLTPPFHPYPSGEGRSVLCGTVPRVAPGGCCPPPCPAEPGPSSTPRREPRPPGQLIRRNRIGPLRGW